LKRIPFLSGAGPCNTSKEDKRANWRVVIKPISVLRSQKEAARKAASEKTVAPKASRKQALEPEGGWRTKKK